jgi:hypothetical protein
MGNDILCPMLSYPFAWKSIDILLHPNHIPPGNIFLTPCFVMYSKYLAQNRFIASVGVVFVCGIGYIIVNMVVNIRYISLSMQCYTETLNKSIDRICIVT